MPMYVTLPPNKCKELHHEGRSVYFRDYCSRYTKGKSAKIKKPYTSLITNNSVENLIMMDHFSTLPIGYDKKGDEKRLEKLHCKMESVKLDDYLPKQKENPQKEKSEQTFLEQVPATVDQIEQAWVNEIDTGKRERGNIYGVAGKKVEKKKTENPITKKELPGLNKWFSTANEYEKEVVHNFVTTVANNMDNGTRLSRPKSSNSLVAVPIKNKSVRINSAPVVTKSKMYRSASSSSIKRHTPSPPNKDYSEDNYDVESVSSSGSSNNIPIECKDASTQLPHTWNQSPSESYYNGKRVPLHYRSATYPEHYCQHCESCKKKQVKRMLKILSGTQPQSHEELLLEKSRYPKSVSTYMYCPIEDYVHHGTSFQNVNKLKKGNFVIHPDFVSEKGNSSSKRKNDARYFGESKVATY